MRQISTWTGTSWTSVPAALLLHGLLLAAFAHMSMRPRIELPDHPESSVDIELLTTGEFDAMMRPKPAEPPPAPSPAAPHATQEQRPLAEAPQAEPGGMVRASRLMAADALANPLSRQARELLPQLDADERVEQLCGLEAMSQIHAWKAEFTPDRVTAYARSEAKVSGRTLQAEGAVFRSGRRWYDLRFRCEFSPDRSRVVAFEFRVGEPVPRALWRQLNLPEIH
ncbi:MAG TPA: DUF930 domain-containing protein [Bosea sp. (in: a-proteobacteria)]|jgi:hypothetical protein|uniref:DUF930 domain-containing protein n=1 Tax=Bosea sp. (in: a-proteobacteria) TaxID=1871050 RepID=UPI002E145A08|nr:DUF930 domain-containing protein [Bosea sp. (in: a-proteobacteria)]